MTLAAFLMHSKKKKKKEEKRKVCCLELTAMFDSLRPPFYLRRFELVGGAWRMTKVAMLLVIGP
jgi:hypothetical protein